MTGETARLSQRTAIIPKLRLAVARAFARCGSWFIELLVLAVRRVHILKEALSGKY
jgi:hypothetical protein